MGQLRRLTGAQLPIRSWKKRWQRLSSSACSSASYDGCEKNGGGSSNKLMAMLAVAETVLAAAAAAAAAAVKTATMVIQATPMVAPWGAFSAFFAMRASVWVDFVAANSWKPALPQSDTFSYRNATGRRLVVGAP